MKKTEKQTITKCQLIQYTFLDHSWWVQFKETIIWKFKHTIEGIKRQSASPLEQQHEEFESVQLDMHKHNQLKHYNLFIIKSYMITFLIVHAFKYSFT